MMRELRSTVQVHASRQQQHKSSKRGKGSRRGTQAQYNRKHIVVQLQAHKAHFDERATCELTQKASAADFIRPEHQASA